MTGITPKHYADIAPDNVEQEKMMNKFTVTIVTYLLILL